MSAPQGFVVVGDTDWLSTINRHPNMGYDSRLRGVKMAVVASVCTATMNAVKGPSIPFPLYAELIHQTSIASGTLNLAVIDADQAAQTRTLTGGLVAGTAGNALNAIAFARTGQIGRDGTQIQSTGLTWVQGDVIGVRLRESQGVYYVQFYRNGVPAGTEVTGIAGVSRFSLATAMLSAVHTVVFAVDGPELRYLPAGAQPWGAAATAADIGGYSLPATTFTENDASAAVDTFRKVVSSTAAPNACARSLVARTGATLRYVEFAIEASPDPLVGFTESTTPITAFDYPGETATGVGYFNNGQIYKAAAVIATYASYTTGDRIGAIIKPSTGEVWFAKNGVVQAGDPEVGTGAVAAIDGSVAVPTATGRTNGRVRLCTHAREQLYRPSYAEAWDGSDLLPERHFSDRLAAVPTVRREVSYYPWANQRQRGAAIGALDLINADGLYDALSDYDLRDQQVIAYRTNSDGSTAREFTALVDGVTQPAANRTRIALADMTAKLDVRVDSPTFAFGNPYLVPVVSRQDATLTYEVCQTQLCSFEVWDQALDVQTWARADADGVAAFARSVNPAGLQSVRNLNVFRTNAEGTLTNGDLSAWTAGAPDGWTVYVDANGGTATTVTQSGSAALLTAGTLGYAAIWQALPSGMISNGFVGVLVEVTAMSGNGPLTLVLENTAGDYETGAGTTEAKPITLVPGTGTLGCVVVASFIATGFAIYAEPGTTATVSSVRVFNASSTDQIETALGFLIEQQAAVAASAWEYSAPYSGYTAGAQGGYYRDRPTVRAVVDDLCEGVLADYYTDAEGVIRLAWLVPADEPTPSEAEYAGELREADVVGDVTVEDDYAPQLSTIAQYQRNYEQHNDGDVAGSVGAFDRAYVLSEGRENEVLPSVAAGEARALHPFYDFANQGAVWPRLLVDAVSGVSSPASAQSDDRLIMLTRCYARKRKFYRLRVTRESLARLEYAPLRPGKVVDLTFGRYDLTVGKQLFVVSMEASLTSPTVGLVLWG